MLHSRVVFCDEIAKTAANHLLARARMPSKVVLMRAGSANVNVHATDNPCGEIRGQLD